MKVIALACFSSNGVEGFPGKVLSIEEIKQIADEMNFLRKAQLVSVEEFQEPGAVLEPEKKKDIEEPQADPTGVKAASKGKKSK